MTDATTQGQALPADFVLAIQAHAAGGEVLTAADLIQILTETGCDVVRAGTGRVRAAATGQAVVIGRYSDGSSLSAACYGPYDAERAEAVAGLLDAGSWYGMEWLVMPVGVLPGGET